MSGRFRNSWLIVKECWNVFKADKEMLLFPTISFILILIITWFLLGFINGLSYIENEEKARSFLGQSYFFLWMLITYLIITFSNAAVVYCVSLRLKGENPTITDGIKASLRNAWKILLWSLGITIVAYGLDKLGSRIKAFSALITSAKIGISLATYFVVPVMVLENKDIKPSITRSSQLMIRTWGETAIGKYGVGQFFAFITVILALTVGLIGGFASFFYFGNLLPSMGVELSIFLLTLSLFGPMILIVVLGFSFGSLFSAIYCTLLYNYASTGKIPRFTNKELLLNAFASSSEKQPKKRNK